MSLTIPETIGVVLGLIPVVSAISGIIKACVYSAVLQKSNEEVVRNS